MDRFKGVYRIESSRLPGWDYTSPGWYFITICTRDMIPWFGEIDDGEMIRNRDGEIIAEEWEKTKIVRHNITIDKWVVMPNHFHGIIVINWRLKYPENLAVDNKIEMVVDKQNEMAVDKQNYMADVETPRRGVSTEPITPPKSHHTLSPNSIGSIIGQFKSICTKRIRMNGHPNFAWQPRFHDHMIRDGHDLNRIRKYIIENPVKWYLDENNPNRQGGIAVASRNFSL